MPAASPPIPQTPRPEPPKDTGAAERDYLTDTVILPLMTFSLAQEAAIAAERQRAQALVARIDAFNAEQGRAGQGAPPRRRWPWPLAKDR